jgi:hypothetical protein
MDIINPLAGYLQGSSQVERTQTDEKQRQVRRSQILEKNVAAQDDELEHQVESTEDVVEIHDEQHEQPPKKRSPRHSAPPPTDGETDPSHLDLTA